MFLTTAREQMETTGRRDNILLYPLILLLLVSKSPTDGPTTIDLRSKTLICAIDCQRMLHQALSSLPNTCYLIIKICIRRFVQFWCIMQCACRWKSARNINGWAIPIRNRPYGPERARLCPRLSDGVESVPQSRRRAAPGRDPCNNNTDVNTQR